MRLSGTNPAMMGRFNPTTQRGRNRMVEFDMSLVQRGARLRRSPFYEAEQRYGPKGYTVYNHMLFPIAFDDLEAEYRHLLEHVTIWDVADRKSTRLNSSHANI